MNSKLSFNKENQQKDLSKVEQRIKLLIEENQRLNQSLKNKLEEIQSLKQENNSQLMELNKLRGIDCEQKIIQEIIVQKTSDCEGYKRKLTKAQQIVSQLEDEIINLKSEKDQYCKDYLELQNQIHELERSKIPECKSSRDDTETLKLQISKLNIQNDHQQQMIKQLQEENASVKKHLGCLSGYILENEQLRKENQKLSEDYQSLIRTHKCG